MDTGVKFSTWGHWSEEDSKPAHSQFQFVFGGNRKLKAFMGWDGIVVLDDSVDIIDMCREYMLRVKNASCGQCFPCRLGSDEMSAILQRICDGYGRDGDIERLKELAHVMKDTSKCGIGETTPRPLLDALNHYRDLFESAIAEGKRRFQGSYLYKITAPCTEACPSHLDIPGYIENIRLGYYDKSLEVVRNDCPLPGTIGRVCVRPCESQCRRALVDEAIAIKTLKRFAADYEIAHQQEPRFTLPPKKQGRVAVIGAGPAGLSCAFYLGRLGYQSTIFEALPEPGGMAAVGIPDYRLPRQLLRHEVELIEKTGAEIRYNTRVGQDISVEQIKNEGYRAIFVGVGAHEPSSMRCEGEEAGYEGFMTGVEYLRRIALGEKPLSGKKAVVVGGGNVAMDCVRSSLRLGFKEVNLVYRRTLSEMPADQVEIEEAQEEGVIFNFQIQPVRILAENGKVRALECLRMQMGQPDASGRRRPEPIKDSNFEIECEAIIPAIGQTCSVDLVLPEERGIELTRWKTIEVDDYTFRTGQQRIFGGGDCATGPASLIEALNAGKKAAKYINQFLDQNTCYSEDDDHMEKLLSLMKVYHPNEKVPFRGFEKRARQKALDPDLRIKSFDEVEAGLTEPQAIREASRCLRCYRIGLAAL
ncbi:MAG: FAD-dependent oxidoreductase [Desulfohalobiaceae bacterium]|nr:FAD-dependent oxidoreductase [Desulfohalobiaceae bacterium]